MVQYTGLFRKLSLWTGARLFIVISLVSCNGQSGKSFLPDLPGYDSKTKEIFVLHKQLLEISGITYINNRTLAAINDEDGKVFTVDFTSGKPASVKFDDKGDYEDMVFADSIYYVIESKGNVHRIPVADPSKAQEFEFPKKKKIEFESLYYDKQAGKLVLLSKEQRRVDEAQLAYSFDPVADTFSTEPYYTISLKEVKRLMKDYSAECKPSAAAIHPILNKLFVIASVGKVLLICALKGEVE